MVVSREDVIRVLQPDEPRYSVAAQQLGDDAAPILEELVRADSVEFAAKAASLAGFLSPMSALAVLRRALAHDDAVVRVAATAALQRQPELAADLALPGLQDPDLGVRKWTLRTIQAVKPSGVRSQVEALASTEEVPALRRLASQVAAELPPV